MNRRRSLQLLAAGLASAVARRRYLFASESGTLTPRPFQGTRESLRNYRIPDWFSNAKFGIWSHWGPQSAVGEGDWYARKMYIEGTPQYQRHVERFGPQCRVGYKDLIHLFTADRWDPDALMDLYVKAGAKYFFSMGVHHDNFDLWNSKFQPRWNSVATGPRRDIVGEWRQAARKRGLRFGVSDHLSNSFDWFAPAHLADTQGAFKNIAYDGSDPAFADLYHDYRDEAADFAQTAKPMGRVAPERWMEQYRRRIKDLVDQHQPDLLYTDGLIPFENYGLSLVAEEYNVSAEAHHGVVEGIYQSKLEKDCEIGTCMLDRERGVADAIRPQPWQTDTCIGDWHYKNGIQYKSAKKVIDLLVDIISKNGNLLLNLPLPANGELDSEERTVLAGITEWMSTNNQAVYGTKPWTVFGEGPSSQQIAGAGMNEKRIPDLTAEDFRFTTHGEDLYVFVQGPPRTTIAISSLGMASRQRPGKIRHVRMLGSPSEVRFRQTDAALLVTPPDTLPTASYIGVTLHVSFA